MGVLDGRVAAITGGGAGIGRAAARLFASEGATIAILELDEAAGRETARLVEAVGAKATVHVADVADEASVQAAFEALAASHSRLDVLYNCAGGSRADDAPVDEMPMSAFASTIHLDLKGTVLCCQAAVPMMIEAGGGSIVNMSSVVALRGIGRTHAYSAAKGAIISLTRAMAGTYGPQRIRVNAICPALAMTERVKAIASSGRISNMVDWDAYPFAQCEPEDIANVALFLASDKSRAVNGVALAADGGISAF